MPPNSRLLMLAVMFAAAHANNGYALPPVQTSGKIATQTRLIHPSRGTDTLSFTNTVELRANSYIWEPWFGLWQAAGAVSRVDVDSETDTSADLFTGDVQVNLFHRSRFPFSAFLSVSDSRVEISDISQGSIDTRTVRMGVTQQYQDVDTGTFYLGALNRDEQENLTDGGRAVQNRILLSADRRGEVHSLSGVATGTQSSISTQFGNSEATTVQANVSHSYQPSDKLSVSSYANASKVDATTSLNDATAQSIALGSQGEWRPDGDKLRLRASLDAARQESFNSLAGDEYLNELRTRVSGRYELTDEAVIFSELGASRRDSDQQSITETFQTLSATYTSKPIDWNQYSYTWNGGAGLSNRTNSEDASVQSESLSAGHSVTRAWVPDFHGPLPIVFSAGQEGRVLNQSDEGMEFQVVHRATVSATHASDGGTTYGQLSAFDVRNYGRIDNELFSIVAAATHNRRLSRYRSIDVTGSYNYNASESDGAESQNDNFALEVRYFDTRLYDINRLQFESRLRATVSDVFAISEREMLIDLEWDNRLTYRIGLLEVDARAAVTQSQDNRNILLLLSLTRRF